MATEFSGGDRVRFEGDGVYAQRWASGDLYVIHVRGYVASVPRVDCVGVGFERGDPIHFQGHAEVSWEDGSGSVSLLAHGLTFVLPSSVLTLDVPAFDLPVGSIFDAGNVTEPPEGTILRGEVSGLAYHRRYDGWHVTLEKGEVWQWHKLHGVFRVLHVGGTIENDEYHKGE